MSLDLDFVRAQFPALSDGYLYLDNAGGSQTLRGVAARLQDYLLTSNVQHGASYEISVKAVARVESAVAAMASYMGARQPRRDRRRTVDHPAPAEPRALAARQQPARRRR